MLTETVISRCLPRHRNTEFLKFLRTIDREVPKELQIQVGERSVPQVLRLQ